MLNFEYIDLPRVPKYLLLDIRRSLLNPSYHNSDPTRYRICEATKRIYDFVSTIFDPVVFDTVNVQLIRKDMPWHIDSRRTEVYNYLLDPGNPEVTTNFETESVVIEPHRWHRLNTSILHNVTGMRPGNCRLAICVFKTVKSGA